MDAEAIQQDDRAANILKGIAMLREDMVKVFDDPEHTFAFLRCVDAHAFVSAQIQARFCHVMVFCCGRVNLICGLLS